MVRIDDDDDDEVEVINDPFAIMKPIKRKNTIPASALMAARKREKVNAQPHALALANRFAVFNSNVATNSSTIVIHRAAGSFVQSDAQTKKPKRPPPLIISNSDFQTVKDMLVELNVADYALKITAIGLKIQCDTHESARKLGDLFKTKNM